MTKRITLAAVALALAIGGYLLISSSDRRSTQRATVNPGDGLDRFISRPNNTKASGFSQDEFKISPGEKPLAEVFDEKTGRLKYRFRSKKWEPVQGSQSEFNLEGLEIQIHTPKGQVTYIQSANAGVTLARNTRSGQDVKRGRLTGGVDVTIDRTTSEWRAANPESADRYAHPDSLIHIKMQDARFDMDLAELISDGDIEIDSSEARVEGVRGLKLQWNQVDNRIDVLQFAHGGKMTLRRGGRMIEFGVPGAEHESRADASAGSTAGAGRASAGGVPRAQAMRPMNVARVSADEAAEQIRQEAGVFTANKARSIHSPLDDSPSDETAPTVRGADALASDVQHMRTEAQAASSGATTQPAAFVYAESLGKNRIHTYRALFTNKVVVEQHEGLKLRGRIDADRLELNFDFGKKQESLAGGPRPSKTRREQSAVAPAVQPSSLSTSPPADTNEAEDLTRLVLTWDGPLELKPLLVDPDQQTGERFDAIAVGSPVRIKSDENNAICRQLVYRHERRQVWLAGEPTAQVELSVGDTRRLVGDQVYYDQSRGLARVDGGGSMIDQRKKGGAEQGEGLFGGAWSVGGDTADLGGNKTDSVEIKWSRGVDLEIARRPIQRVNPSTGANERHNKEFLRRAWFHGDVAVRQGKQGVTGDELAVTFGVPGTRGARAEYIEDIDAAGKVRMQGISDGQPQLISAEKLQVAMTIGPDGKNIPRAVDAEGAVLVRQGDFETRADKMHVVLAPGAEGAGVQVEQFDGQGRVAILDPATGLDIHDADRVTATMRAQNQLIEALVLGAGDAYAHAGYGDFAVDGNRIQIDAEKSVVQVPGPGKVRMITRRDFGGRELKSPEIVDTVWQTSMRIALSENVGEFHGAVHSESQSFQLDGDKLTIRFASAPPQKDEEPHVVRLGLNKIRELIQSRKKSPASAHPLVADERKRPSYVLAEGNAAAIASKFEETAADAAQGRLLSRLSIFGAIIEADLVKQEMGVPCPGDLLIEDYQFKREPRRDPHRGEKGPGPLMTSSSSDGPSQTSFNWGNSMKYFVDQGLVAFDKSVHMEHRSGRYLVKKDELLRAAGIDPDTVPPVGGRRASLDAGHLLVEFMADEKARPSTQRRDLLRATDLRRLIAEKDVHLQEAGMSLMGEHLQYVAQTEDIVLEGTPGTQARIFEQDESKQNANMWRGPRLVWNRRTNRIESNNAVIRSTRR